MALTPFFLFLKFSFFLPMVLLIIRHYIGRLVEAVMGRRGLARAVQSRKLSGADLLRAGGAGEPTAMLHPAVLTRAAGGGQEALGHAASLTSEEGVCYLPITPAEGESTSQSPKDHQDIRAPDTHTKQQLILHLQIKNIFLHNPPLKIVVHFAISSYIRAPHISVLKELVESTGSSSVKKMNQMKVGSQSRTQSFL